MSYQKANGTFTRSFDLGLNPGGQGSGSGAYAAVGTVVSATGVVGTAVELGDKGTLRLKIVTATAGTTATFVVETSADNGVADSYRNVLPSTGAALAAVTATGTVYATFGPCDRWVRVRCSAITGSFTLSILGEAV